MKIYLDIDETILSNNIKVVEGKMVWDNGIARHLKEFLEHILNNHDVYWLTTHCNGDATRPMFYLMDKIPQDIFQLLMRLKPTKWSVAKTEGIDLDDDFLWFDDMLSPLEEEALKEAGKLNSHVKVNLDEDPDIFKRYLNI